MYKEELALNNIQGLICSITQPINLMFCLVYLNTKERMKIEHWINAKEIHFLCIFSL